MEISDWLDEKEEEGLYVSQIELATNMPFDEEPDEIVFFRKISALWVLMYRESSIF